MASLNGIQKFIGVDIRKKLGKPNVFDPLGIYGIYRIRNYGGKKYRERLDFYDYVITHTETQQNNRSKFADAVFAWQGLAPAEKARYNKRAVGRHYYGYQLFIREYMLL